MEVSLRQLTYFVAVADEGSFSAAAATFPISHSAVSLAINDLERSLAVQLFHRQRARGVSLTDAGRQLLPEARRTIESAANLQRSAQSLGGEVAGELVVGSYAPLTASILARAMASFAQQYPLVDVRLQEGSLDSLQESVQAGQCELALMYDVGVDARLPRTVLFTSRPLVILSSRHPLATASTIHLRQLAAEPLIMTTHRPSQSMYGEVLRHAGAEAPIRHQTANLDGIRSLVAHGCGWSILLQQIKSNFSVDGMPFVSIPIADEVPEIGVALVSAATRPTQRARAFTSVCRDLFPPGISDFEAWTGADQ